jgi:hypothetical protein
MLALAGADVAGQTATATLTGVVMDPQAATITGARVAVKNQETGITRTAESDAQGSFRVPALLPGSYELRVERDGFKTEVIQGIVLQVNQTARVDVTLDLGNVAEQVTVQGTSPLLQTEEAMLGQVVSNRMITELPLNGRQFLQLATLTPGVATGVNHSARQAGMRGALTNISVNGARAEFNNYLLDGVTNTDGNFNLMVTSPSVDTLQEFKVQTSSYSAEFGRSVGAQVNAVTKSGSNDYHGSLYEFLRNDKFDARNFFARPGAQKPPYRQNQFGASIGGPVSIPRLYDGRNRTFFFFNYEGLRIRQAQTAVSSVPTDPLRNGNFSSVNRIIYDPATTTRIGTTQTFTRTPFAGNVIPANRIDSVAKALTALYPLPNTAIDGLVNNYVDNRSRQLDSNQITVRADQQITARDSLFVRYIFTKEEDLNPGNLPGRADVRGVKPQNLALNYTRLFSPALLNEFKAGYLRSKISNFGINAGVRDIAGEAGIQGLGGDPRLWGIPGIALTDFTGLGDATPDDQANNTFHWIDNVSWTRGRHALKFGAEVRRFQFNLFSTGTAPSNFQFDGIYTEQPNPRSGGFSFADFLLGAPRRVDRSVGDSPSYFRRTSYGFYVQDDWKVHPRLTLNLGLRYEVAAPFTETRDGMITVDPQPNAIVLVRAGEGDPYEDFSPARFVPSIRYVRDGRFGRHGVTQTDANNFGPRFGFAWDPTGSQKWAVRGGFGVFFTEDFANPYFDMARNAPKAIRQAIDADPITPNINLQRPFGDPNAPLIEPRIFSIAYDIVAPYVMQWSLTVQRQLPGDMVIETGYAAAVGHKISAFQILNVAQPGPGAVQPRRTPSPEIGTVTPIAPLLNSNYHALRLRAEKRLSYGISFISAYTWSKAIDDGPSRAATGQPSFAQNPWRIDLDRSLSEYDMRHVFRLGATIDLPSPSFAKAVFGGWRLGSIVNYLSGNPTTISSVGNANIGVANLRADVVPGVDWRLSGSQRSPQAWFNTAAFARPANFTFGNSGRNIVTDPSSFGIDLSILKSFRIIEGHQVQFRAEMFNMPNHPNFGRPNRQVGANGFGTISSAGDGRQIQFALKYTF